MVGPVAEHSQYLHEEHSVSKVNQSVQLPVGGEGEGVDGVSVVEGVQMLAVVEVPQHGLSVLAT